MSQLWYQKLLPDHSLLCKGGFALTYPTNQEEAFSIWSDTLSNKELSSIQKIWIRDWIKMLRANYLVCCSCVTKLDWPLKKTSIPSEDCFCCIFEVITEPKRTEHFAWCLEWMRANYSWALNRLEIIVIDYGSKNKCNSTRRKKNNKNSCAVKLELRCPYQGKS